MKYSGVIKFNISTPSNYKSAINFDFYLASFFIEEVTYKGIKYREHELFGYTFPKEVLARIKVKAIINFKNASTTAITDISSFDKTQYKLTPDQVKVMNKESDNLKAELERGLDYRFKLMETNAIEFPINKNIISEIIQAIKFNKALKTKEQQDSEYSRLLTEGNIFLNENNFKASLISYTLAKQYTDEPKDVIAKIGVVEGYLGNNNRTKYRWENEQTKKSISREKKKNVINRINFDTDFESKENQQKYLDLEGEANIFLVKNEYDKAIQKFIEAKEYTTNKTAIDQKIAVAKKFKNKALGFVVNSSENKKKSKRKRKKEKRTDTSKKGAITNNEGVTIKRGSAKGVNLESVKVDTNLSYPELLKKGSEYLGKRQYITSKAYFEAAREKAPNKETVDRILISVNKLTKSQEVAQGYGSKLSSVKASSSKEVKSLKNNSLTALTNKAEVLKAEFGEGEYRKGFIKYKRDEQAVLDAFDKVLIPFGKYEILRYRSGFANIKMKDPIALKTIECTGKNDEYSWSARIYQNPWIETVVDKNGEYVDDLNKRVEIYVVDNVSLLPWDEVPQRIKDAYKDPNQFTGTDFVSAFKLWEHENANRPDILARRKEIQSFKDASKDEAYKGANKCKREVAKSIEEVYTYFRNLGYEVVVKY